MKPREVFIIDAIRTPIGKFAGSLSTVRPDDLETLLIKEIVKRNFNGVPLSEIEDVILGNANGAGEENRNIARMCVLLSGLDIKTSGVTVNRLCGSGMQAFIDGVRAIRNNDGDCYLVGGVESMSRAPFVIAKNKDPFGRNAEMYDTTIGWRFTNPVLAKLHYPFSMGETAENVAEKYSVSRERQDKFAYNSQMKAKAAIEAGKFKPEIVPVEIKGKRETVIFDTDEFPRFDTTIEALAKLKPAFREGGTVTAGNSSGINDGASLLMIASEEFVSKYNLKPRARYVSSAVVGVDPSCMGIGPVPATKKALSKAGLNLSDINLIELNEAFAAQSIACIDLLGLEPEKINVNGGAIALGHPLGSTGSRIIVTLLNELERKQARYGLATMCIGVGQGIASIIERI
ncbi:MAG: thiolase family protein [Ignavibacteriaceae bacterium]|jgi:acetyl-CoA acetyltransferases|nr:MAG: thiolase family protein [Chlorobiota bacterium]KXK04575.1 MAG: acetyl-CoA C-acetyltransferase [Chlorobi bacterium OLB4]MBV6399397.1 3-oxoadipyl-CoA/3-oxo-5,6-dehydrosuberyl-CoA thiolase [Ignavibacteria bacterium]MCC6886850.1 thiolase family protein [Ignavibacteriales bacterium]MCE7953905.1 thiolase family protein [Chlorobi bacterium CHB7]MDL1887838.1 thiolase family protein [Ignavibacteria bacterium CHB1]MEB2330531.1 thiolase family protein [Ignavibacteriaceae bacterium]OQY76485.1 MA